jgi:serine/threonine protein kinase
VWALLKAAGSTGLLDSPIGEPATLLPAAPVSGPWNGCGLRTGDRLGHYVIRHRLGAGGMGEVFSAADRALGREVALKVLPRDLASQPERLRRFREEARVVASLNHRNVVTIFSIEKAQGLHFFTMELVDGQTLDHVIPASGLSPVDLFRLSIPLADAVAAAHAHGVVHRDLKPRNVMVDREGRVKILDFGLARIGATPDGTVPGGEPPRCGDVGHAETPICTGPLVGTPAYMSPEQVLGRPLDSRTDVFSLGVLLHEMATGRHAFRKEPAAALLWEILHARPDLVKDLRPDMPEPLSAIVLRCLEKEPVARYPSALELRNALRRLREEHTSGALEAELRRLRRRSPRRWFAWAGGG